METEIKKRRKLKRILERENEIHTYRERGYVFFIIWESLLIVNLSKRCKTFKNMKRHPDLRH